MDLISGFKVAEAKSFFLDNIGPIPTSKEVYSFARSAAVQRGNVYNPQVSEKAKLEMWDDYSVFADTKKVKYKIGVTEAEHLANIFDLVDVMSHEHSSSLKDGVFRFGTAQKLFNLTLKYFWVKDEIEEPPHAPIDSYVVNNIGKVEYLWTKSTSSSEYLAVIERCKKVSKAYGLSVAQWELLFWNMAALSASIE